MGNWVKQYKNDPFGSFLSTPITTSGPTTFILSKLAIYRNSSLSTLTGLEIGMAHGYFLVGPFATLGPLRNTEIGNFTGFLATLTLIFILGLALIAYGLVSIKDEEKSKKERKWWKFSGGFIIGGFGGAGIAYQLLNYFNIL